MAARLRRVAGETCAFLLLVQLLTVLLAVQETKAVTSVNPLLDLAEDDPLAAFDAWKAQFRPKGYSSAKEEEDAFAVWKRRVDKALEHNAKPDVTYWQTLNHLSDLPLPLPLPSPSSSSPSSSSSSSSSTNSSSDSPSSARRDLLAVSVGALGLRASANRVGNSPLRGSGFGASIECPTSVDWNARGAVTNVKDQTKDPVTGGSTTCGACWAFSAAGAMEAAYAIATNTLVSVSAQQLLNCACTEGQRCDSQGCNGGWPRDAFDYVMRNGGVAAEATFPYEARWSTCDKIRASKAKFTLTGYTHVKSNDETELLKAVCNQPVVVALEVRDSLFNFQGGGIYSGEAGCGDNINHAALIVGYGTDAATGKAFWLVKNSWGTGWGQSGYARIERGKNVCGLVNYSPAYPTVLEGDPVVPTLPAANTLSPTTQLLCPEPFYTVKAGDTMWNIAQSKSVNYLALLTANAFLIDPDYIFPGNILNIPCPSRNPSCSSHYIVKEGDDLYTVAGRYNVGLQALLDVNPQFVNPDWIYQNDIVNIPPCTQEPPEIQSMRLTRLAASCPRSAYITVSGDTLNKICSRYRCNPGEITPATRIPIRPGTTLLVPRCAGNNAALRYTMPQPLGYQETGPVCAGSLPARLFCAEGLVISQVISAFYGRTDTVTCPATGNTQCNAPGFTEKVRDLCKGKASCPIPLDLVPDPCPGTSKYAKISYVCAKPPSVGPICGDEPQASLTCPGDMVISDVLSAFYGRSDNVTCPYNNPAAMQNTACSSATFATKVLEVCKGRSTCAVPFNQVSDPCFGTYKWYRVSYACSKPSSTGCPSIIGYIASADTDAPGFDIKWGGVVMETAGQACSANPWCRGFNTDGWVKRSVATTSVSKGYCLYTKSQLSVAPSNGASVAIGTATGSLAGCIEVPAGNKAAGVVLQQGECFGVARQNFFLESTGTGWWRIRTSPTGVCIIVRGGSAAAGTDVMLANCIIGSPDQEFSFTGSLASGYTIRPRHASTMCVGVTGGSSSNGARIAIFTCNNGLAQLFALTPLPALTSCPAVVGYTLRINTDASGNDMRWAGYSVATISQACSSSPWCRGFNTNGLLKSTVTTTSASVNCLYVRNQLGIAPASGASVAIGTGTGSRASCFNVASKAVGVQLQQWECFGGPGQNFYLESTGDGWWRIKTSKSGLCLDVQAGSTALGTTVALWLCADFPNQHFSFVGSASTGYSIRSRRAPGMCLDIDGVSANSGARVQLWQCYTGVAQLFALTPLPALPTTCAPVDGYSVSTDIDAAGNDIRWGGTTTYAVSMACSANPWCRGFNTDGWIKRDVVAKLATNGYCLYTKKQLSVAPSSGATIAIGTGTGTLGGCIDVPGGIKAPGVVLQQFECNGSAAQKFVLESVGGGWFRMKASGTEICVGVRGMGTAAGTDVMLWFCNANEDQQFSFTGSAATGYRIRPRHAAGMCIDISGISASNGARVQISNCYDGPAQLFMLGP